MGDCGSPISLAPQEDLKQLGIPLFEDSSLQTIVGVGGYTKVLRSPPVSVVLAYDTPQEMTVSVVFYAPIGLQNQLGWILGTKDMASTGGHPNLRVCAFEYAPFWHAPLSDPRRHSLHYLPGYITQDSPSRQSNVVMVPQCTVIQIPPSHGSCSAPAVPVVHDTEPDPAAPTPPSSCSATAVPAVHDGEPHPVSLPPPGSCAAPTTTVAPASEPDSPPPVPPIPPPSTAVTPDCAKSPKRRPPWYLRQLPPRPVNPLPRRPPLSPKKVRRKTPFSPPPQPAPPPDPYSLPTPTVQYLLINMLSCVRHASPAMVFGWLLHVLLLSSVVFTTIPVPPMSSAGTPFPTPPVPAFTCCPISSSLPHGVDSLLSHARYSKDPDTGWSYGNSTILTPTQQQQLQLLLHSNKKAFAFDLNDLVGYTGSAPAFALDLDGPVPPAGRRRHSPDDLAFMDEVCTPQKEAGIIEPCSSTRYCTESTFPRKKDADGNWTTKRHCLDFRATNKATPFLRHPLPRQEELMDKFGNAVIFSKLDFRSGFHQVPLRAEDREKTAFRWKGQLWQYTRMPFGLKNACQHFMRMMDHEIQTRGLSDFAACYVDDILVFSTSVDDHLLQLQAIFEMCHACGLRIHPAKCVFGADSVEFLGHYVSMHGTSPAEAKVKAIIDMPVPANVPALQAALGLFNYYRGYVPNFSAIAAPLYALTQKGTHWRWTAVEQDAYTALKTALTRDSLAVRCPDLSKPFILHTDFSNYGCGAVLSQVDPEGLEYMVACASRSLNDHEKMYCSFQGEMLAVVWAVRLFRFYLQSAPFTVVTDHQPLQWILQRQELVGQHARWALILQDFDFVIKHRPGDKHRNADALSRLPLPSDEDVTGARLDASWLGVVKRRQVQVVAVMFTGLPPLADVLCPVAGDVLGPDDSEFCSPLAHSHAAALRTRALLAHSRVAPTCQPPTHPTPLQHAATHGVVLVELFGGICTGLECMLHQGITVKKYIYCDIDPAAQRVAHFRMCQLAAQFPSQFPTALVEQSFQLCPQDIQAITQDMVTGWVQDTGDTPVLLIAGWPCQDMSCAGPGTGLEGSRSGLFFDLMRVKGFLQCVAPPHRFAYVFENVVPDASWRAPHIKASDCAILQDHLGPHVVCDAARMGSYAHRIRAFWTNVMPAHKLQSWIDAHDRPPGRFVQHILDPGRTAPPPLKDDKAPFYCCNTVGQPLAALPTLVSFPQSYAFRNQGPGTVFNPDGSRSQPSVPERERILGFQHCSTNAPGVTDTSRHDLLGRVMDRRCLDALLACFVCDNIILQPSADMSSHYSPICATLLSSAPASAPADESKRPDIWSDDATMAFLRDGIQPAAADRRRVAHRAKLYAWRDDALRRHMAGGASLRVPPPDQRNSIISTTHEQCGHFGVRRTVALLRTTYWWRGMVADVHTFCKSCAVCDQVHASFNTPSPHLSPLPICGLFYRWGVDLCGPFPLSCRGNAYVMVAIEHFAKVAVMVPIPDKEASTVAWALLQHVLSVYGGCAELLSDRGGEFRGAFQDLLVGAYIDHRRTSSEHPQADGLAERCVQTLKTALKKCVRKDAGVKDWDSWVPWIALGYNCSCQMSTGTSPFHILYARSPAVPPAIREKLAQPLDVLGNSVAAKENAALSLLARAQWVQDAMPVIASNLEIAQHRDVLRYARTHSGSYTPQLQRFRVGDYVYVRQPGSKALGAGPLTPIARDTILRVISVKKSGVLRLIGSDGKVMDAHATNCAPCHLPDLDGTIDHTLARPTPDFPCILCNSAGQAHAMLLCDGCGLGFHIHCLQPPLPKVPEEDQWFCPSCTPPTVATTTLAASSFPLLWNTPSLARTSLQQVLPGHWPAGHSHSLHAHAHTFQHEQPSIPACDAFSLLCLTQVIDMSCICHIYCPWFCDMICTAITTAWQHVTVFPCAQSPAATLCSPFIPSLQGGSLMLIAAPDTVTDVLLGLHSQLTIPVCAFVPLTYMCMAPGGRARLLNNLRDAGRVSVALCESTPAGQVQWCWLCVTGI